MSIGNFHPLQVSGIGYATPAGLVCLCVCARDGPVPRDWLGLPLAIVAGYEGYQLRGARAGRGDVRTITFILSKAGSTQAQTEGREKEKCKYLSFVYVQATDTKNKLHVTRGLPKVNRERLLNVRFTWFANAGSRAECI